MSIEATSPRSATTEVGYARSAGDWWSMVDEESTPELQWPRSVEVYDSMRRQDAQVASVLRAVTLPVRRTTWRVDPGDASPKVTAMVAADLGLPVVGAGTDVATVRGRDRFSWSEHLRLALLMLPYGHMFFEQVYRIDDNGVAHLRKLGPRMPRTISAINVAVDGGLISVAQYPAVRLWTDPPSKQGWLESPTIPVKWLVAYVLDREAGNWLGNSILRPSYKNWMIKDRLLRVQAQTIERNGMGIPEYEGAEGETDLSAGLKLAQSWRSGEAAGAAIPYGAKLRLVGVDGDLPDATPAIRYHDEQIARAVLAHFLNLGTQTGSWALGSTFADFFTLSLQALGEQLADVATHHIVEDLVDLNFGPDEPAPRIVFDEIGSRRDATAAAIKVLVDAGVVRTDSDLEEFVRTSFGLPSSKPGAGAPPPGTEPTS